jgi:hypothetical protein
VNEDRRRRWPGASPVRRRCSARIGEAIDQCRSVAMRERRAPDPDVRHLQQPGQPISGLLLSAGNAAVIAHVPLLRTSGTRYRLDRLLQSRTCGRFAGGPPVFADCCFMTLDDQSSSSRLVAGSATKQHSECGPAHGLDSSATNRMGSESRSGSAPVTPEAVRAKWRPRCSITRFSDRHLSPTLMPLPVPACASARATLDHDERAAAALAIRITDSAGRPRSE